MKAVIALVALFSVQAFACPNLTGTYSCTYEGQTEQIQMSQTETNGVTVYTMKNPNDPNDQGGSLPADNVVYKLEDSEQFKNGTIRGWCEGEAFKIEQIGSYFDQGQHIGDLQAVISMSLNGGNLVQDTQGVYKTGSGDYPISNSMTCSRVN